MSFDNFWTAVMTKNPIKESQSVRLTKGQFYGILKQAYEAGKKSQNQYDFMRDFFGLGDKK